MKIPEYKYEVLIRESHLDTFGHVNNAAYSQLFEEARWEIVTANGYGVKEVQQKKRGPVLLEANLKFLKEIKLREKIVIRTRLHPFVGKVGKTQQEMLKEDGTVGCEANFTVGFFDLSTRKLIEPPPDWLKAIGYGK
ncbi:MAG TPA: thioesterase family protein [Bdellovibrionota bacterium]